MSVNYTAQVIYGHRLQLGVRKYINEDIFDKYCFTPDGYAEEEDELIFFGISVAQTDWFIPMTKPEDADIRLMEALYQQLPKHIKRANNIIPEYYLIQRVD